MEQASRPLTRESLALPRALLGFAFDVAFWKTGGVSSSSSLEKYHAWSQKTWCWGSALSLWVAPWGRSLHYSSTATCKKCQITKTLWKKVHEIMHVTIQSYLVQKDELFHSTDHVPEWEQYSYRCIQGDPIAKHWPKIFQRMSIKQRPFLVLVQRSLKYKWQLSITYADYPLVLLMPQALCSAMFCYLVQQILISAFDHWGEVAHSLPGLGTCK